MPERRKNFSDQIWLASVFSSNQKNFWNTDSNWECNADVVGQTEKKERDDLSSLQRQCGLPAQRTPLPGVQNSTACKLRRPESAWRRELRRLDISKCLTLTHNLKSQHPLFYSPGTCYLSVPFVLFLLFFPLYSVFPEGKESIYPALETFPHSTQYNWYVIDA